jgi:aminoglycoside/choline kinase family phosphotransferase
MSESSPVQIAHDQRGSAALSRFPQSVEAITPAWLTEVLRIRDSGLVVRQAEILEIIRGASSKVRLRIWTESASDPRNIIVKGGFEPHSKVMVGMHLAEVRAYRDVLPGLNASAPRCYFAGVDPDGEALVILEDLDCRGATYLSLLEPMSFERAQAFLDELARLHARHWADPNLEPGRILGDLSAPMEGRFERYILRLTEVETFAAYLARPRGASTPRALHDRLRLRRGLFALRDSYKGQPRTIVHGDMHLGNLYLDRDGLPGLLDWVIRRAPWQNDVTYFLVANLDLPDRRRWEGALLQHYMERLRSHGIAVPDFDAAWLAHRRDVVWGFFVWLLNSSEFQTEAKNTAAATRFAMAMLDHDTYATLGV